MRIPLELRAPMPRRNEDREFVQLSGHAGGKPCCGTKLLAEITHFRASQLHIEWPLGIAARTGKNVLDEGSLCRAHLAVREWPKAISAKTHLTRIHGLSDQSASQNGSKSDRCYHESSPHE